MQPRDRVDGQWNRNEHAEDADRALGITPRGHNEAVARAQIELVDRVAASYRVSQARTAPDRRRAALDAHVPGLCALREAAGLRDDVGERLLRRGGVIAGPRDFAVDQQPDQRLHLHDGITEEFYEMRLEAALELRAQDTLQRHGPDLRQVELGPVTHDEGVGELGFSFDADDDAIARLKVAGIQPRPNQRGPGLPARARALEPRQLVAQGLARRQDRPLGRLLRTHARRGHQAERRGNDEQVYVSNEWHDQSHSTQPSRSSRGCAAGLRHNPAGRRRDRRAAGAESLSGWATTAAPWREPATGARRGCRGCRCLRL